MCTAVHDPLDVENADDVDNPNNVAIEVSPLTTIAEMEVGDDLCRMFGYNIDKTQVDLPLAWGHITCGGSIANLESMW